MRIIALSAALALAAVPAAAETIGRISLKIGLQAYLFDVTDETGESGFSPEQQARFTGEGPSGATLTLTFDGSALGQVEAKLSWIQADGEAWSSEGRPMDVAVTRHRLEDGKLFLEGRLRGALGNGETGVPVDGLFGVELPPDEPAGD
ncbi:hypothetical protein ACXN5S_00575 [Pseudoroseicyclus sp. H15]